MGTARARRNAELAAAARLVEAAVGSSNGVTTSALRVAAKRRLALRSSAGCRREEQRIGAPGAVGYAKLTSAARSVVASTLTTHPMAAAAMRVV